MDTFDYIVIGSGAAGGIVAERLSADKSSASAPTVCVLEAGPVGQNLYTRIPAAFAKNLGNPGLMWQFRSEPAEALEGRSVYLPQGRLLGGSTSINGMVYNRGQARDFDYWASLGNPGWAYQDVLPYFRRTEQRERPDNSDTDDEQQYSQYRGDHGPLRVSDPDRKDSVCDAFIDSVSTLGVPTNTDYNAAIQRSTGYYQRTISDGRRVNVANAFLQPARNRHNLKIETGVQVTRLIIENGEACGVETLDGRQLRARCEVIVSAGTVNSAKLLQLSGIGNGELLQSHGIKVEHDLPGVGENFRDHYFVRIACQLKAGVPSLNRQARGLGLLREIIRWQFKQPSILGLSPSIAYAFLNSADPANADPEQGNPDLQFVFTPGSYRPGRVYELDKFPAATCGFTQQRPESSGYVRITSNDPLAAPQVQPNYLQHETDQQVTLRGMKLTRRLLQTDPLASLIDKEVYPGEQTQSDDELMSYAKQTGNTGYHLVGTCTMGPASSPGAVVGADLRVHGVGRLRVIDASIMPQVTSSNTCAASMMIGEKGADMLLENWRQ